MTRPSRAPALRLPPGCALLPRRMRTSRPARPAPRQLRRAPRRQRRRGGAGKKADAQGSAAAGKHFKYNEAEEVWWLLRTVGNKDVQSVLHSRAGSQLRGWAAVALLFEKEHKRLPAGAPKALKQNWSSMLTARLLVGATCSPHARAACSPPACQRRPHA